MKIKYWLLTVFMAVMILPVLAVYAFYVSVEHLDQRQSMEEFLHITGKLREVEQVLDDVRLYRFAADHGPVTALEDHTLHIKLFDKDGYMVYESGPLTSSRSTQLAESKEYLYRNLYDLQRGNKAYTLKKPVLAESGELVGFYEMMMSRDQWVQGYQNRRNWITAFLIGVFLLLFGSVSWLLNRKLNRPLNALMQQMKQVPLTANGKMEHQSKDEIGQLITHFEEMKAKLQQAQDDIRREQKDRENMVAAISHDLKTPLTSIRAYTEFLEKGNLTAGQKQRTSVILQKADHMQQMIEDLNMYALLRSEDYNLHRVRVEGEELFEMLVSGYEDWCQQRGIRLHTVVSASATEEFNVDVKHMVRFVDNLMSNAIRHTPQGGNLWLAVVEAEKGWPVWMFPKCRTHKYLSGKGALLIVQNEGSTVPDDESLAVFKPFYQGEASRNKAERQNSGLGLSICKMIIEKHGGQMQFCADDTKGTTVAAWLPEHSSAAPSAGKEPS